MHALPIGHTCFQIEKPHIAFKWRPQGRSTNPFTLGIVLQMTDGVRSKLQKILEGSDEYAVSAHVDYLNLGEIIDIMPLQSLQRRLLRTRYLKPRLNNLRRGRNLLNYYRVTGLLKTLTGVLV